MAERDAQRVMAARVQPIRETECDREGCSNRAEFYLYDLVDLSSGFAVQVRLRLCASCTQEYQK